MNNHILMVVSHLFQKHAKQIYTLTQNLYLEMSTDAQEDLPPGTLDHACSFDNLVKGLQILHNPKKAWKIPVTQSYLLSFHEVFIQGLCQNLTSCRTVQPSLDPLHPYRAHQLPKHQKGPFHMNICII